MHKVLPGEFASGLGRVRQDRRRHREPSPQPDSLTLKAGGHHPEPEAAKHAQVDLPPESFDNEPLKIQIPLSRLNGFLH